MTDDVTAAPTDGGQAAPAPAADAGQGAAPVGWQDGFSDDMKGYIENKGFKDASSLAESYQNLEKLRGVPAEQLLQIPADMSDREAMLPVYAKMGMPETAEKYTNVLGDGFDSDLFKSIADRAHMLGLGDGQFQGLQEIMGEQSKAMLEAQETASADAFDQWKGANADGFNNAARLMANVGMDEAGLEGLLGGDKASMYDFLAKVAGRSAEAAVVQGEAPADAGFGMSPSAAKMKIAELMGDTDFQKGYTSSNKMVRDPLIKRMSDLHEIAARA